MIAAVIGEELGLIGILVTVAGVRRLRRARLPRSPCARATPSASTSPPAITCLVTGQAVVNLGAVLGFLPLTGVPLPLISSGGSSLIVFLTLIGTLLNVADGERASSPAEAVPPMTPPPSRKRPRARSPRVLIAAGGTAGHVVPSLAVAAELTARGAEVMFAGTAERIEARLVPAAGLSAPHLPRRAACRGGRRSASCAALGLAALAPAACTRILRRVRPDVVFGGGGYVAGPMLLAAAAGAADPGGAARDRRPPRPRQPDGGAVRPARLPVVPDRATCGAATLPADRAPGAARGARRDRRAGPHASSTCPPIARWCSCSAAAWARPRLNRAATAAWAADDPGFTVVHITGEREFATVSRPGRGRTTGCCPYTPSLGPLLAAADLVVSRAGGSVFEIAAAGRPAILVPSPNVTADHQTRNAEHIATAAPPSCIADSELTAVRLAAEVDALLADPARLHGMGDGRPAAGAARRRRADRRRACWRWPDDARATAGST